MDPGKLAMNIFVLLCAIFGVFDATALMLGSTDPVFVAGVPSLLIILFGIGIHNRMDNLRNDLIKAGIIFPEEKKSDLLKVPLKANFLAWALETALGCTMFVLIFANLFYPIYKAVSSCVVRASEGAIRPSSAAQKSFGTYMSGGICSRW